MLGYSLWPKPWVLTVVDIVLDKAEL